ncbi:MAG TPA: FAD/NAD(P)-binding protein [Geobacteraceae bacterium]
MTAAEASVIPRTATIIAVSHLSADTALFSLRLEGERPHFSFVPGQFIQLSMPGGGEAPISLAAAPADDGTIELCVRRVGRITTMLHNSRSGDRVGIRGPFGNGFPLEEMTGRDILLIAGGLGMAPLRSLLHALLADRDRYGALTLMYGAREPAAILFREELVALARRTDVKLLLTVDFVREEQPAGLACNIGLLPALLAGIRFDPTSTSVAICGPPPLYGCTIGALVAAGCPEERIYLSLERRMKCGQGLCCHCAVGDLLCCTDGPVFRYGDIRNVPGAL